MTGSVAALELRRNKKFSFSNIARRAVFSQLEKLHSGCILVVEGDQKTLFGEALLPGDDLYSELHVKDSACFSDILASGSIGAAESFMTGDWTTPDLTRLVRVMVRNRDLLDDMEGGLASLSRPLLKWMHRQNQNSEKGSKRNIAAHYDLGNALFELFLDPTMMYSSGLFPSETSSMEDASINKLKKICESLDITESDHVVEIGSGWGGFAIFAAKNYGCRVTTTTISTEQYSFAEKRIAHEGLQDKITLLKQDYRDLTGQYDKLVSIEMIEAVGWQFYQTFFNQCAALLKPDGLMLIQAITIEDQRYDYARKNVDFIQKYIFPGSCIPSIQALLTASKKSSDLRLTRLEDFAPHYALTLKRWYQKFQQQSDKVSQLGYSDEFKRMWEFYLCYCEGGFAERSIGVAHMRFAKPHYKEVFNR